jgi:hypothetical protein
MKLSAVFKKIPVFNGGKHCRYPLTHNPNIKMLLEIAQKILIVKIYLK